MPCFSPITGHQDRMGGRLAFTTHKPPNTRQLHLACGQGIGCKLEHSRRWAVRGTHEASLYEENAFGTLTYSDDHLPRNGSLVKKHLQDFNKRARYHIGPFRFIACGEYGETTGRPHYHFIMFGKDWPDKKEWSENDLGDKTYTSELLDKIWGMGQCITASVSFNSIAYVTRYVTKKITGPFARFVYTESGCSPEFGLMSRRPGIGAAWMDKWASDIYTMDKLIINGKEQRPPKYYDALYARTEPEAMKAIKKMREQAAFEGRWENTPRRLHDKEIVTRAAIQFLQRNKA